MVAPKRLLALNAGSSSLKAELFVQAGTWQSQWRAVVEGIGRELLTLRVTGRPPETVTRRVDHAAAAELLLDEVQDTPAVRLGGKAWLATVHRVVHGASLFSSPELVTPDVLARLGPLTALAPLHNPPALDVLHAVTERFDGVPAVAVFDTAFFRRLPPAARTYALPASWRAAHSIERYGFHGIAHEYLYRRCAARSQGRVNRAVTLQLGSGCSAAALREGLPVDTSMGFTPLEGLVMGTRAGDVDTGILLHLARAGEPWADLDAALNRESGLLGLSEQTGDMTELLLLEQRGEPRAALAVDVFCHRARKYIGAFAAVLGGLDVLAFGGGIGENAAAVRRRICEDFEWLGLELDERANLSPDDGDRLISSASSAVAVHVIPVREERAIARQACECLGVDAAGLES
jgi:acetate kinase